MQGLTLDDFYAAWELYATPAVTGAVVGLVLGLVGVYVVLRRLVFLAAAVGQAASLGVVLSFFLAGALGAPAWLPSPTVGAVVLTFLATLVVAGRRGRSTAWRDSALGMVFLVGAAGTLALGTRVVQEVHDVDTLLFGSAVAVLPEDFELVVWVFGGVFLVHIAWWRGFAAVSFDLAGAVVRRMPVVFLEATLFLSLALAISVGTRVVGALPVFALSVLPAVVAARLASSLRLALVVGAAVGMVSGYYGYLFAFVHELPVGASQTLVAAGLVILGEVIRRIPALPLRLAPGAPGPHEGRARRGQRVAAWGAMALGAYVLGSPLLAGLAAGWEAPALVAPELVTVAVVVAVALAAVGGVVAWRAQRRPLLALGFAIAAVAVLATGLADIDDALIRPLLLGAGLLAVGACHRDGARAAVQERAGSRGCERRRPPPAGVSGVSG